MVIWLNLRKRKFLFMMYPKLNALDQGLIDEAASANGVLNLAGNFSTCERNNIPETLLKEALQNSSSQIVIPYGLPELVEQIAQKTAWLYGHQYNPEREITITAGANQAFYATIAALVNEGDEVILFEPANEAYLPSILLNGGKPVYITLKEPDFHIDWEEVMRMINANTRMIIINTPHNPTGMVLTELDMIRLQKIITGTRILVVSDESFEHIVFDGYSHQSVALYPKLVEKSILINTFSHSCQVPGWNAGYCAAPANVMQEIRKVLNIMGNRVFIPFQQALASYINQKQEYQRLGKYYQEKRDYFAGLMESLTRLEPCPTYGTFYQLYSFKNSGETSDRDVVQRLIQEFGVGVTPISRFFHEKSKKPLLRINFAQPKEVLTQVVERLQSF